ERRLDFAAARVGFAVGAADVIAAALLAAAIALVGVVGEEPADEDAGPGLAAGLGAGHADEEARVDGLGEHCRRQRVGEKAAPAVAGERLEADDEGELLLERELEPAQLETRLGQLGAIPEGAGQLDDRVPRQLLVAVAARPLDGGGGELLASLAIDP